MGGGTACPTRKPKSLSVMSLEEVSVVIMALKRFSTVAELLSQLPDWNADML